MNTEKRKTVSKTPHSLLSISVELNTPIHKTLLDVSFRLPRILLNPNSKRLPTYLTPERVESRMRSSSR